MDNGHWSVEIAYGSSLLCTFNTPFGGFSPKRLPFVVKVSGIADDILVFDSSDTEHDQALDYILHDI